MNSAHIQVIIAGLLFGMWPLIYNRSGLSGNPGTLLFVAFMLVIIVPYVVFKKEVPSTPTIGWLIVFFASVVSAMGLFFFTDAIGRVPPQKASSLFVLMIVVQIMVPAIYEVLLKQSVSIKHAAGFICAILAAILLA
jgi:drug/metabolite transporter (DMT)-like permease